ncbi:hypothetical protein EMIHUDRAFT_454201 [Emiliania huxleyi CCMP1516]|uniref:Uncharacterized protein n=2 Tax=Emiliania huxleyi TaxID=2903 RepID=A0A0D3KXJ7_EMIH1|nr:hypothetical protein EMIHUDRAFT_454201 [Emiliania huxleyi CCMP1516]EOD40482.1 hypothetical protein EMIHUDRAFT_454201 [Emiliania huxleyi CCMP1516]|eukprot:XP_005792911.1 hypothetical protein EMIHUDRAFT_454201 [Emiliania huxleyi CCMP1516]
MACEDSPAAPIFTSTPLEGPSSGRQTGRKEPRLGGPDEDSIPYERNSVESPRTPPHSRRIVSCACAGPVGRAPTVAKELAESVRRRSSSAWTKRTSPPGLPRVAQMVTFQLMECADDAIKALFAADGAGLKGKVSKKKALAQLLCDMVGAPMLSPDEAESAGARVLPKAATSSTIATSATVPALAKIVDIVSALSTARLGSQRPAWVGAGRTPDPAAGRRTSPGGRADTVC